MEIAIGVATLADYGTDLVTVAFIGIGVVAVLTLVSLISTLDL